mgnify:CR=1 FL=1
MHSRLFREEEIFMPGMSIAFVGISKLKPRICGAFGIFVDQCVRKNMTANISPMMTVTRLISFHFPEKSFTNT